MHAGDPADLGSGRVRRWKRVLLGVGLVLAAVLLIGPLLIPLPPLEGTLPPADLLGPGDDVAELSGIDVRYRHSGSGEPAFLLLHGFGASTDSWEPVIEALAAQVVAFDRVGFGLTERPLEWRGDNPYGSALQAELALGLLDRLEIGEVIVIAHSAGAETALDLALDHRDRISGLVLEAPSIDGYRNGLSRLLVSTPQGQRVARFAARRAVDRFDQILESAFHDPSLITDEIRSRYRLPLRAQDWDRGLALFAAAPGPLPLRERLGELSIPVLVITGDDDGWVPAEDTIDLAGEIPGADLEVLTGCGHLAHEECPDAFIEVVEDWTDKR